MNNKVKPKIDITRIGQNPLIANDFIVKANKIIYKGKYTKDKDLILPATGLVEYDKCTKVYNSSEYRLFTSRLSPGSKSLYLWLIYEADYNLDYIWINKERYMEETDTKSINTYKSAITELVRYCVLCPMFGKKEVYWINPRLMFNGNRINMYPDNVRLVNDSTK